MIHGAADSSVSVQGFGAPSGWREKEHGHDRAPKLAMANGAKDTYWQASRTTFVRIVEYVRKEPAE